MLPALTVLALGLPVTGTLVVSQVVLSFGIPFALVPLTLLTRRRDVMGALANSRPVTAVLSAVTGAIVALNVYLICAVFLQ
jgi:manganese transport protein